MPRPSARQQPPLDFQCLLGPIGIYGERREIRFIESRQQFNDGLIIVDSVPMNAALPHKLAAIYPSAPQPG